MKGAALISGGSSGIGFELARGLAQRGHGLALLARDKDKLRRAMGVLKAEFPHIQVVPYPVDVSDPADTARAVAAAHRDLGDFEWVVANAGITDPGLFRDQPLELHRRLMEVNYMGALHLVHAALPRLPRGHLVFISSGAAFFGIYGYASYGASKFAMRGLAESLRLELAPEIAVTLAYPPDTDTPQLAGEVKPPATAEISKGKVWQPRDVARLILGRAERGKFTVAPGLRMIAALMLHSLLGPGLRLWQRLIIRKHTG